MHARRAPRRIPGRSTPQAVVFAECVAEALDRIGAPIDGLGIERAAANGRRSPQPARGRQRSRNARAARRSSG
jgi:hypothetical protein